jgi:hypothetical protein
MASSQSALNPCIFRCCALFEEQASITKICWFSCSLGFAALAPCSLRSPIVLDGLRLHVESCTKRYAQHPRASPQCQLQHSTPSPHKHKSVLLARVELILLSDWITCYQKTQITAMDAPPGPYRPDLVVGELGPPLLPVHDHEE